MELTQLKYFQTVAKTGNVSRAAEKLHITQPNLSKSIARLEEELGVLLFDHRKGKIALNEYGRVFLSSVDLAFSELTTGVQTIQRLYETNQGVLSLACSIDDFLPDLLKSFSLSYPQIGIRQFGFSIPVIVEKILDRTLNLALTSQIIEDTRIITDILGEKEFVIIVHKNHPLASKRNISIGELADEKFICDCTRFSTDRLKDICRDHGFSPKIAFEVESSELVYRLIEGEAGVAFIPLPQILKIKQLNPDSQIRSVRIRENIPKAIIGFAYHRDYVFSEAADLFIGFVKEWLDHEEQALTNSGNL